jgi:uncharacterized phage infection (PIP) family protein YhgE
MSTEASPNDERFDQIDSVLNQLANSQRHLLTAQVLMNDRLSRTETIVEGLAPKLDTLTSTVQKLAEKVDAIADGQRHTDDRIDLLADIVRQWIERSGNGSSKH